MSRSCDHFSSERDFPRTEFWRLQPRFKFELLCVFFLRHFSSLTDRVSDKAVEVDGNVPMDYFLRVATAETVSQLVLLTQRVANKPFLTVADEQMSNAKSSLLLSSSCLAPPTSWVSHVTAGFQEAQAVDSCDISRWREPAHCCALITACLSLPVVSWKLSRHHELLSLQLDSQLRLQVFPVLCNSLLLNFSFM